jgi:hypothetical protein
MLRCLAKFVVLLVLGVFTLEALADTPQTPASATPPATPKTVHRKAAKAKAVKASSAKAQAAHEKDPPALKPVDIPPMTPEQLPAQAPQVSYQDGRLTVNSENSTMKDILGAIRKQTNVQMDLPATMGTDRVAAHLAGLPRDVISSLLEGTSWDYIIVGSPTESDHIQSLIVTSAGGGVATSLSRGSGPGATKGTAAIPGEAGVKDDDEQNDAGDQQPAEENAEQPEPEPPQPPAEEPPPGFPHNQAMNEPQAPGTPVPFPPQPPNQPPGMSSNNPNQPQSIDQFNQNMRPHMPPQLQQQQQQQQQQQ